MTKFIQYLKEVYCITLESRDNIWVFPPIFLFTALIEMLSITLLSIYITLLLRPDLESTEIVKKIYNYLQLPDTTNILKWIGVALVLIFTLKLMFFMLQNYLLFKFSFGMQVTLRKKLLESYLNLSYEDFISKNTSEYIQTISGLVGQFAGGTIILVLRSISDIAMGLGILLILLMQDASTLLNVMVVFGGIGLAYDLLIKKRLQQAGSNVSIALTSVHQNITEIFRGFKEIKVLGVESYFIQKIIDESKKLISYQTISQIAALVPRQILEYGLVIFLVLMVGYKASESTLKFDSLLTMATFSYAGLRLLPIISTLFVTLGSLRYGRDTVSRLYVALNSNAIPENKPINSLFINGGDGPPIDFNRLELKNIDFSYKSRNSYVLKNASMTIESGDLIGIIGESGAGKSTLIEIILGIVKPTSGTIILNGRRINSAGDELKNFWKNEACYLPQEIFVLNESIETNISLIDNLTNQERERVRMAVKKSSLEDFIVKNDLDLSMNIGEGGSRLSGGQRQRLAIARLLFHNRNFLVLDEATSALDIHTQQEIMNEILSIKGSKTIILISHRQETLINCNKIYKIYNKTIVEVQK
jgi:ABC-type multidrug transport system fused ATPase/permease subunit